MRTRQDQDEKKVKQTQAERVYNFINPADGYAATLYYFRLPFHNYNKKYIPPRPEEDRATPVEEAYFKHYLNLGRDTTLIPDTDVRLEWDKDNGGNSEYVGIPQPVARRVQSITDTLNTGKIYREYDKYIDKYPELPSKRMMKKIHETGKRILTSGKEEPVHESMSVKYITRPGHFQENATGLEIFGRFNVKWDKENKTLQVYDTYDFPSEITGKYTIPERKRPLRIRDKIKFDPEKGSFLLRNNMENYYIDESKYYE